MVILPFSLLTAFLALMLKLTLNLSAFVLALPMLYIFGCGLYTLYCREWTQFLILFVAEFGCFFAHRGRNGDCGSRRAIQRMAYGAVMEETMDKDKMLDYFNDREATLFRDELGSNARYHELLRKKLAAEDAHRKMVGEAAWKQYLQLDEICNELESVRYQAMYLAGAADFEKLFRQS